MTTFRRISICLSSEDEAKIRRNAKGYRSLSAYCRDKLMDELESSPQQEINRDNLEERIKALEDTQVKILEEILKTKKQVRQYSQRQMELMDEFVNVISGGKLQGVMKQAWDRAEQKWKMEQ